MNYPHIKNSKVFKKDTVALKSRKLNIMPVFTSFIYTYNACGVVIFELYHWLAIVTSWLSLCMIYFR